MISAIIPNYNCRPLLSKCINSVRQQTYRDWECIIVDDGSTDGSPEELKRIVGEDKRFKLILKEKNEGLPKARNTGIKFSKGDLVFLDSDDWIEPDIFQTLVSEAQVHPDCGRIFTPDFIEWKEKGWFWPHDVRPYGIHKPDSPYPFASSDCDLGHSTGCLYVRDRIPCKIKFPNTPLFEDMIFNMGLIFAGVSTFVGKKPMYHYVRRGDSLLANPLTQEEADIMRKALKDLYDKYPNQELYNRFSTFLENAMRGRLNWKKMDKEILVVIPYLASAAQGTELKLAVAGWRKHFKNPHKIVIVGDDPKIKGEDIIYIPCPRINPIPGQYTPALDHVHKFREVRKHFPDSNGFVYTCDDIYAVSDITIKDIMVPKYPEIATKWLSEKDWNGKWADWYDARGYTAHLCRKEGLPVRDWVCHMPVYYEWDRLIEIFDKYDADHFAIIPENIYFANCKNPEDARNWRDEIHGSNPNIRPIGTVKWITNQNSGWSLKLENILKQHYGLE